MPAKLFDNLTSIPASFVTKDKRIHLRGYVFLALLCFAFFAPGIVTLPPTDRDESSFAQATKQMIETGNYVDIRLQDKPRYKKPIGIYWLQAASVKLFNRAHLNEIWAYRIPSFLGATIAVLVTAALGSLLFNPMTGLLAAIMMAGCVILNVEARLAKTDAALLASIMVAQYALARAYLGKSNWKNAAAFWTALGIGILIKGPIILLMLASTLLWLHLKDNKKLKWFNSLKPLAGIPYLLLLVLPWFIAIMTQSHGEFATQSAGHDLFAKLWEGQNRGILPPGVHLLALPIIFFPFGLFVLLGIPDIWEKRNEPAIRFCLGWIIPAWIVFELSLTKLPHYTLPLYPAIAILASKALLDGFPSLIAREGRWLLTSIVCLWFTIGIGFAALFTLAPFVIDQSWSTAQMIAGIVLVTVQAFALFLFKRPGSSVTVLAAGSLVFLAITFGLTLPSLQHLWMSRQMIEAAESVKNCDKLSIVSSSYGEPSLVFLAGTNTKITKTGSGAAYEMINDPCAVGMIDSSQKESFMNGFGIRHPMPLNMGKIEGLNIGHGKGTEINVYVRPVKLNTP